MDELPEMLWAYRTIARTPTRETTFSLAYGNKAMVPVEIRMGSLRRKNYDSDESHLAKKKAPPPRGKATSFTTVAVVYQRHTVRSTPKSSQEDSK